jgi:hypothetical protein
MQGFLEVYKNDQKEIRESIDRLSRGESGLESQSRSSSIGETRGRDIDSSFEGYIGGGQFQEDYDLEMTSKEEENLELVRLGSGDVGLIEDSGDFDEDALEIVMGLSEEYRSTLAEKRKAWGSGKIPRAKRRSKSAPRGKIQPMTAMAARRSASATRPRYDTIATKASQPSMYGQNTLERRKMYSEIVRKYNRVSTPPRRRPVRPEPTSHEKRYAYDAVVQQINRLMSPPRDDSYYSTMLPAWNSPAPAPDNPHAVHLMYNERLKYLRQTMKTTPPQDFHERPQWQDTDSPPNPFLRKRQSYRPPSGQTFDPHGMQMRNIMSYTGGGGGGGSASNIQRRWQPTHVKPSEASWPLSPTKSKHTQNAGQAASVESVPANPPTEKAANAPEMQASNVSKLPKPRYGIDTPAGMSSSRITAKRNVMMVHLEGGTNANYDMKSSLQQSPSAQTQGLLPNQSPMLLSSSDAEITRPASGTEAKKVIVERKEKQRQEGPAPMLTTKARATEGQLPATTAPELQSTRPDSEMIHAKPQVSELKDGRESISAQSPQQGAQIAKVDPQDSDRVSVSVPAASHDDSTIATSASVRMSMEM